MEGSYILVALLVIGSCSAEIISGKKCQDESKVLCTLRKADCASVDLVKNVCPVTCKSCPGDVSQKLYNLTYFDFQGRGEQIRWILEQADANWEDTRVPFANWAALKPTTLTGQLPFLEVEGTTIAQSGAIAMYLGMELGLAGNNHLEIAEVHMIWDTVQEAFNSITPLAFERDPVKKAAGLKKFHEKDLPRLIRFLEHRLKDGDDWLVDNKLTLADIATASLLHTQTGEAAKQVQASKTVSALHKRVLALPRIQNWIATRPN